MGRRSQRATRSLAIQATERSAARSRLSRALLEGQNSRRLSADCPLRRRHHFVDGGWTRRAIIGKDLVLGRGRRDRTETTSTGSPTHSPSFCRCCDYDIKNDDEEERETIPVFQAIDRGNLRAVEQFLADGGGVESRNATGPDSAGMAAAIYSWPKIVRLLLQPFRRSRMLATSKAERHSITRPRTRSTARNCCWRPEPM